MVMLVVYILKLLCQGVVGFSLGVIKDGIVFWVNYEQQLLELIGVSGNGSGMIVVVVVVIMVVIVILVYQDYVICVQVVEGFILVDIVKIVVVEYCVQCGCWLISNVVIGLLLLLVMYGKYVDLISVGEQGMIIVYFGSELLSRVNVQIVGKMLEFILEFEKSVISWSCYFDEIFVKKLLVSCCQF